VCGNFRKRQFKKKTGEEEIGAFELGVGGESEGNQEPGMFVGWSKEKLLNPRENGPVKVGASWQSEK